MEAILKLLIWNKLKRSKFGELISDISFWILCNGTVIQFETRCLYVDLTMLYVNINIYKSHVINRWTLFFAVSVNIKQCHLLNIDYVKRYLIILHWLLLQSYILYTYHSNFFRTIMSFLSMYIIYYLKYLHYVDWHYLYVYTRLWYKIHGHLFLKTIISAKGEHSLNWYIKSNIVNHLMKFFMSEN